MKKVLLSLSMLAAVMVANAQTLVPVYGGNPKNTKDSVNSAEGFASFKPVAPATVPTSFTNNEVSVSGNTYLQLTGSSDKYYVWGASNGRYVVPTGATLGVLAPFGYNGTAAGFVALKAKADMSKPLSKLKIGFVPSSDQTKTFSAEIFETGAYNVPVTKELEPGIWKSFNIPFASFYLEDSDGNKLDAAGAKIVYVGNPTAADTAKFVTPTLAQIRDFGQINVILNTQSCNYSSTANACQPIVTASDVSIDDIYLTQSALNPIPQIATVVTSTQSAAANIASTKVYPNPTTGEFTAEVSLVNNASVSIILTDMMGKQIATESATNGSAKFNTAGLAKGMYTVTYVLDGTPAKTELVVVK